MQNCEELAKKEANSKVVLTDAHSMMTCGASATACILLPGASVVHATNFGDSGWMWYRSGELQDRSFAQTYRFNAPYQLAASNKGAVDLADSRDLAVKPGDVLVVATDGLYDNLFDDEIGGIVGEHSRILQQYEWLSNKVDAFKVHFVERAVEFQAAVAKQLAKKLAQLAYKRSKMSTIHTPFELHARKKGYNHNGGKEDDICVVVAI